MKHLRNVAAIAALLVSLGLGACATTNDTPQPSSAASDTSGMPSSADERSGTRRP